MGDLMTETTTQRKETNMPATITPEAVEKTIIDALPQFGVDASDISRDSTFEELDVDSLDLTEIAQIIDEEYGVELKGDDAKNIKTVGDVVELVVSRAR
jgi:acyl carrier protein